MTITTKIPKVPSDASDEWYQMVKNPKNLKGKVPLTGGVNPEIAFQQADDAMRELSTEYFDKLGSDIKYLEGLIVDFKKDHDMKHLDQVYNIVHNMRGQGATFNFPLVSDIGKSFCRYASARKSKDTFSFELVVQHFEALRVVYRDEIKGDNHALANAVVTALSHAVDVELDRDKG